MREQSCSIPRGLKINKNSAEGEVFLVDFPSYRTLQALRSRMADVRLPGTIRAKANLASTEDDLDHSTHGFPTVVDLFGRQWRLNSNVFFGNPSCDALFTWQSGCNSDVPLSGSPIQRIFAVLALVKFAGHTFSPPYLVPSALGVL
jgi:hypothetical protein